MPVSPGPNERLTLEVRRAYADAERIILEKIARRIGKDIAEVDQVDIQESSIWAQRKLTETRRLRIEVEKEVQQLRGIQLDIRQAVQESYEAGSQAAVVDLEQILEADIIDTAFTTTHQRAVQALLASSLDSLEQSNLMILRKSQDIYRSVIAEASEQVLTGARTRTEAAQDALNRFANRGVTAFVDNAGRSWEMATYAEMAVRSATGQAAVQGHFDRLQANNRDLVIVSDSPEECPLCRPWEGKVLSISGEDPERPSVQEARDAGLWHPNCTHSAGLYVPGLTRPLEGRDNPAGYEQRQEQRYNERQIRKWKRREAVAITDNARAKAKRKVREWQARQREFIDATERRRRYDRESITRAR